MKRKVKTWAVAFSLAVCLMLCTVLGTAFMKVPEASAEEISTYSSSEDVTETIEAETFAEGVTYESDEGVYFEYDGESGGFVATGYRASSSEACLPDTLTISCGGGNYTYPVVGIEDGAFKCDTSTQYDITYIRVGRYVEYVGKSAFYNCRCCTRVDYFAENAISVAGPNASQSNSPFAYVGYHGHIAEIYIGETVEVVPDGMFEYSVISALTFAEGSGLKKIGAYAFYQPKYLVNTTVIPEIRIPDTVESIGEYAFGNVYAEVEAFYIPENLTEAGKYSLGLNYVDEVYFNAKNFPEGDAETASPFCGMSSSQYSGNYATGKGATVYIGRNVERIPAYCFASSNIRTVAVEGGDGYSLESIAGYAFNKCEKLTSVTFPSGVEKIEPYAFYGCSKLTSVTLGDTDGWYVTEEDGTKPGVTVQCYFYEEFMSNPSTVATYLTTTYYMYQFNYTDGFTYEISADGTYYVVTGYIGDGGAATVPEIRRGLPVTEIADEAFSGVTALTSAVIPGSVEKIGSEAFKGCTSLSSLTIAEAGLKEVGKDAFSGCTALKSLYVSDAAAYVSADYENRYANPLAVVSGNGGKFYVGGATTTSIAVYGTDRIGTYALAYCTAVSSVTIGDTVETIDFYAFYYNTSITSVAIPSSVTYIGPYAFKGSGVTNVTFAVTGGWKVYGTSGSVHAEISAAELSSNAAELLAVTYPGYLWQNEKTNFLPPVISGASTDPEGFYTNGDISVYVSVAEGAYVTAIYWKAPGEDEFSSVAVDSLTLSAAELVCGTYVFYAEDSDGNVSDQYFAVFDNVPPEIYATGATIFDGYVGEGFTVYASDNLSPVTLYYSYAGGAWGSAGGDSYDVPSSSGDGRYSFYAEDLAGNRCGEYTLILDTVQPVGRWEKEDHGAYALSFVWDDVSWSCEMNGSAYVSGTPITDEGSYTATLTTHSGIRESFTTDLGHNFVVETVTSGNCEEGGTAVYVCTYCGASYEAETSAAAGHTYTLEIVEPTCETEGYTVSVCTVCGAYDLSTYTYLSPLGHSVYETERAATCEEDGFRGGVCLRCGKEFEGETVPATGHLWYVVTLEAGCESEGYRETVCLRCSEVSAYEILAPLGHDYREVSRTEATCEESSLVTYRCSRCSSEYEAYVGDAAEHDYSVVSVVKESSCGVEGERRLTCSLCGAFVTEAIPALSHNNVETGRYKDSDTGETFVTYTCSICGESFTVSIGNQEEAAASGITGMMDTYTRYMWWILLATVAVWSIVMGVRYAMSRNSDDKAKAKSMIINYVIGIVVIAVILVACPYLVYAIALLAG